ncbi:hypothetical protein K3551_10370 [Jannaschia sp. M317]|nr:hypothetical protein K3551_10370 [Jannaschia sp. M317]
MASMVARFRQSESGAVTVDWVVLTAAVVGLGLAIVGLFSSGFTNQTTSIQTGINGTTVKTSF